MPCASNPSNANLRANDFSPCYFLFFYRCEEDAAAFALCSKKRTLQQSKREGEMELAAISIHNNNNGPALIPNRTCCTRGANSWLVQPAAACLRHKLQDVVPNSIRLL